MQEEVWALGLLLCILTFCMSCLTLFVVVVNSLMPSVQFSSVQLLSCVRLFVTPWTAARQASLSTDAWRMFLMFCPQWELWTQLLALPVYLLPHIQPLLSSPATTTQPQAYQRWLAVPRVTLLCSCGVPTLEGSEKLSCVPVSCSWWHGTDTGCQARI